MEPATLYLIYIAATGGPEKRVVTHFDSTIECEDAMARWRSEAAKSKRYNVVRASCLTTTEYNAMTGVFTTDALDSQYRP